MHKGPQDCSIGRNFDISLTFCLATESYHDGKMDAMLQTPTTPSKTTARTASTPRKNLSWQRQSQELEGAADKIDGNFLNDAMLSPPPSNTRRWRHKKHFQTIVGHKRYQLGSPTQALTPDSMEADMRRLSIRDSLQNFLDNVDHPSLD